MEKLIATHIELRSNRAGEPRAFVAGTRIRVSDIYLLSELQHLAADAIVEQLPMLNLGQVYAALSYAFDHRQDILTEIRADDAFVEQMKSQTGPGPLEMKLNHGIQGRALRCLRPQPLRDLLSSSRGSGASA